MAQVRVSVRFRVGVRAGARARARARVRARARARARAKVGVGVGVGVRVHLGGVDQLDGAHVIDRLGGGGHLERVARHEADGDHEAVHTLEARRQLGHAESLDVEPTKLDGTRVDRGALLDHCAADLDLALSQLLRGLTCRGLE